MRTISARPLGGWVAKGSEIAIPFGAFRRLDNAEIGEDVLRVREGRTRLNHTAPKRACLEGRQSSLGYGLVKAEAALNPGASTFTVECTVRLPKVNRPTVTSAYPLVVRTGSGNPSTIYALELFSTGAVLQVRVHFTTLNTTTHTATARSRAFTLTNSSEGTVVNFALRRGGNLGGTAASMELVVDGTVRDVVYTLAGDEVLYGTDAAETELAGFPGSYATMTAGDRDFMDLFVLNSNPDFAYPPATPYNEPMQGDPRVSEVRFWSTARSDSTLATWGQIELDSGQITNLANGLKGYWRFATGSGREEINQRVAKLGSAYLMPNPPMWAQSYFGDLLVDMGFTDWWRLEETTGTTAKNSITSGRDGTYVNSPGLGRDGLAAVRPGLCAEFSLGSGAPGGERNVAIVEDTIWYTQPYTIFALAMMKGPPTASTLDVAPIMLKEGSPNADWSFSVGHDSKPFFTIFDDTGGGKTSITAPNAMPLNRKWAQAGTVSGTTMKLFVNGVLQGTATTGTQDAFTGFMRIGATGDEQFIGLIDECAFGAGVAVSDDNIFRLSDAALNGTPTRLDFLGRDHVVRWPYIAAYDRIASADPGKAVKTWTYMWRFRTGNYLQNYVANGTSNANRRMVLFQWGNDPALPQIRASILRSGANYNFIVETTHNGTVSTMTSSTNLSPNTTYNFWATRNGTALEMYLDNGTGTVATATITSANNTFGTGTTGDIFLGAGVATEADADAYQHEKYFYGQVEEVRLYARVVAQDTRTRTYLSKLSKADIEADADLLFCAQFPEGVGRTTLESSKSANVGLLTRDFFHGLIGVTPFQWSREKPVRWRAGFVTPNTAPPFIGLGSYVKEGASTETVIGVAGGIAYEVNPELTEQIGTVADAEAVSDTRPFAAVAMENRLYLGDGRNPVVAVENGVVRPCGIADMPASAVPGIEAQAGGQLLGYYSWATQLKSAFTGALSRATKTEAKRFRDERAIVGFGTGVPGGYFARFDGISSNITFPSFSGAVASDWTTELMFRTELVYPREFNRSRGISLDNSNDNVVSCTNSGGTTANVAQPTGDFTYELRFRIKGNTIDEYFLIHAQSAAGGTAGIGTIAIKSNGAVADSMDILNGTTVIATLTGFTAPAIQMISVVYSAGVWTIYHDGQLKATSTTAAVNPTASQRIVIGSDANNTVASFANIDVYEFRLWNQARTGDQIKDNYQEAIIDEDELSHLSIYWKFDDEFGAAVSNASPVAGSVPACIFDGGSLHAAAVHVNNRKTTTVLVHDDGANTPGSLGIALSDVDNCIEFQYRTSATGTALVILHRFLGVEKDRWYHVAVSHTAAHVYTIYLDGVEIASVSVASSNAPISGTATAKIGDRSGIFDPFDGDIDEIRSWNTIRTLAQIQDNIGLEFSGTPTGLASYYKLNGDATDSVGADNGTASGVVFTTMPGGQIPLGLDDFVSARRIYRSAGAIPASESEEDIQLAIDKAEAGPFYLVKEIEDNATTQFVDDLPDTSLSILLDEAHAGDPPFGGSLSAFGDRLVVASAPDARSSVFVSGQDSTENFDIVGDSLNVADTKAGSITATLDMTGVAKQCLVFTETGGFSLQENGTRLELAKVFSGVGCVSRLGAVRVEDVAYFWSREGPQRWAYGQPQPIGLDIEQATDDEVNHAQFSQIVASHHVGRRQVYFNLVEVGQTKVNAIYKFEYGSGHWIRDTGNMRCATLASIDPPDVTSVLPGVLFGDDLGYVLIADRGKWDGAPLTDVFDNGVKIVTGGGGAANIVITTADLPMAGNGLKGVRVLWRAANGTEETTTITENIENRVSVSPAFSGAGPAPGDVIYLGPIAFQALSGWLDMNGPEEPPSVTRKRFEWLIVHFDQDGLTSEMPVSVQWAVRERGYTPSPTFEGSSQIQLQAAADTRGVAMENQPVRKFYIPNALGRFFKFKISGTKPSGWGLNQVDIAHQILVGAF